jgi:hypothetical protein
MYLRKARAGSAPGHTWEHDGDVLEVDESLAEQLLRIPGGGFTIAATPTDEPEPEPEPETPEESEPEEEPGTEAAKKKAGRPPLPRDAKGNIIRK